MRSAELIRTLMTTTAAAMFATACGGERDATVPAAQTVTGEQPRMTPTSVTGCLRAGTTDNTFVLTTAKSEGAVDAATYQLTGVEGVNLREHVDKQVQVTGTLEAEQQVTSRATDVQDDRTRGTSGTPTVETRTELDVKRMNVSSITPAGGNCEA